jgi:hypothetical protein
MRSTVSTVGWWVAVTTLYWVVTVIFYIADCAFTQPHPVYLGEGSWLSDAWDMAIQLAWIPTATIAVVIPLDLVVQRLRRAGPPFDMRFFPLPTGLRRIASQTASRLVIVSGCLLLAGYACWVEILFWEARMRPCGLFWGPHWLYAFLTFAWCILWIAESLTRSRMTTVAAALLYAMVSSLLAFEEGSMMLFE